MYRSNGIIVYDPPREGMKRRTSWWCVINVDQEITRYFRWWVQRELGIILSKPSWDAHISVVRGETPASEHQHRWRRLQGRSVDFTYGLDVRQTGVNRHDRPNHFWFVEVACPTIAEIRAELGLNTFFTYHLTVGRTYP